MPDCVWWCCGCGQLKQNLQFITLATGGAGLVGSYFTYSPEVAVRCAVWLTSSISAVLIMALLCWLQVFRGILSIYDLFIAWYFHLPRVRLFTCFPISPSFPYSEQRANFEEAEVIDSPCDHFLAKPLPYP